MARITFSIPEDLAQAAEQRAKKDKRSLSAHISLLVERDLEASGVAPASVELLAAAEEVGGPRAALQILQQSRCPTRRKRALKKAA